MQKRLSNTKKKCMSADDGDDCCRRKIPTTMGEYLSDEAVAKTYKEIFKAVNYPLD